MDSHCHDLSDDKPPRKILIGTFKTSSNNSVVDTQSLKRYLNERYKQLEARLQEAREDRPADAGYRKVNSRYVSTTDPEAAIVRRGKPKLCYAVHRAVDGRREI